MNNAGFYKKEETEILFAPNIVEGNGYMLVATDKDSYEYPIDGWVWANSFDDALVFLTNNAGNAIEPFDVQPENIKLAANKTDEAEFTKLVVMLNLGLQQNTITLLDQITIWDYIKQPHIVTVDRFLQIMAGYGMYCYALRK
jgi:hypothetical protein